VVAPAPSNGIYYNPPTPSPNTSYYYDNYDYYTDYYYGTYYDEFYGGDYA
jgi:hypothetical protein